jgi:hypothetical protein
MCSMIGLSYDILFPKIGQGDARRQCRVALRVVEDIERVLSLVLGSSGTLTTVF